LEKQRGGLIRTTKEDKRRMKLQSQESLAITHYRGKIQRWVEGTKKEDGGQVRHKGVRRFTK